MQTVEYQVRDGQVAIFQDEPPLPMFERKGNFWPKGSCRFKEGNVAVTHLGNENSVPYCGDDATRRVKRRRIREAPCVQ